MESLREKIIAWLVDEDHEVKADAVPKGAPIEWILRVTVKVPVTVKILVQQPTAKKDRIVLSMGVVVSPSHREALMNLPKEERLRIMASIIEALTCLCPDCVVIVQPNPIDPQNVVVTSVVYTEGLTKAVLASRIRVLVNAFSILSTKLNAALGTVPGEKREPAQPTSFM